MSFSVKIKTFHELYVFPFFFSFFFAQSGRSGIVHVTLNLELPKEGLTVIILH